MQLLFSIKQAATNLGVGRTTIYELVNQHELELVKIGSKSLITAASLNAFVAKLIEADRNELDESDFKRLIDAEHAMRALPLTIEEKAGLTGQRVDLVLELAGGERRRLIEEGFVPVGLEDVEVARLGLVLLDLTGPAQVGEPARLTTRSQ